MNGKFIVVDPTQLCGWPLQLHHYNPRVSSLIVQFRSLGVSFSRPLIPLPVFFLRSRNFDDSFRRNAEGERSGEKSFIALVNRPTFILPLFFLAHTFATKTHYPRKERRSSGYREEGGGLFPFELLLSVRVPLRVQGEEGACKFPSAFN